MDFSVFTPFLHSNFDPDWDEEIDLLEKVDEEDLFDEFSELPVIEKIRRPYGKTKN